MVEAVEPEFKEYKEYAIEEFLVRSEPYYRAVGDEIELFSVISDSAVETFESILPGRCCALHRL